MFEYAALLDGSFMEGLRDAWYGTVHAARTLPGSWLIGAGVLLAVLYVLFRKS